MEGFRTPSKLAGRAASGLLSQSASLVTSSESTASPGTARPSSGMVLQSPGPSPASQTAAAASPASTNRAPVGIASVLQRPAVVAAAAPSASGRLPEGSDNTAAAASVAPSEEAAAAASARGGVAQTRAVPLPSGPSGSPQGLTVSPVGTASSSSGTTGPSVGAAGSVAGTAGSGVGTAVVPVGQSEFLPYSVTPEVERWLQVCYPTIMKVCFLSQKCSRESTDNDWETDVP